MLVGIEELQLHPDRQDRSIPPVPVSIIDQVKRFGQLTPVVVFKNGPRSYTILKNTESWLAVQRAGLFVVEIVVRDDIDSEQAFEIINADCPDDPIAEAISYRNQLFPEGQGGAKVSKAKLAKKLGISRSTISHSLRLLALSSFLQTALKEGSLTTGHAKVLLKIKDPGLRDLIAKKVIDGQWSVRQTATNVTSRLDGKNAKAETQLKSPDTVRLENKLSEDIGSRVDIDEAGGKLVIDYRGSLDVLDGVLQRISCN